MTANPIDVFRKLIAQVEEIRAAALREEAAGFSASGPILRRSGFVLAVAALDTYFHEVGIRLLRKQALSGPSEAQTVARYLGRVEVDSVCGPNGDGYIRLGLSYKTLVAPDSIEKLLAAGGIDSATVWLESALQLGSRPDRLKKTLEIVFDRRNQIAHEGDWDVYQLAFRPMEEAHLKDCVRHVTDIVETIDVNLP